MTPYIMPALFLFVLVYGKIKKVNCYDNFTVGAKKGLMLGIDIFCYVAAILICVGLLRVSGITSFLVRTLSPVFGAIGMPSEIIELVLLKPFTGSGSIAVLESIIKEYGADSFISRCACVIAGSSETTFYIASIYFSKTSVKKLGYAIPLALACTLVGAIFSCLVCRIM
ncbi:MAG: nucleoside recognition domain-containing protein [Christensenellales bacterium]